MNRAAEPAVHGLSLAPGGMSRVLTAAVLVPVALAVVLFAPDALFALCLFAVAWLAQREFYALAAAKHMPGYRWIGGIGAALCVLGTTLPDWVGSLGPTAVWVGLGIAVLVRGITRSQHMGEVLGEAGITFFGIFYPAFLVALLGAIRHFPAGAWWIVLLLLVVWCGDTAAYYVGRSWGRHPMAPRISPKKTWEGAIASVVASTAVAAVFVALVWNGARWDPGTIQVPVWVGALLGLALNIAAQVGDLAESVYKRGSGVKDSGGLLPGHGGVLDRIDALLLATPVLWYYLVLRF